VTAGTNVNMRVNQVRSSFFAMGLAPPPNEPLTSQVHGARGKMVKSFHQNLWERHEFNLEMGAGLR
jgi:hypothetical protein